MSFRPRYHQVEKILEAEADAWQDITPPATISYAINKISVHHPFATDQVISLRKKIGEKTETYFEEIPAVFFMPKYYLASIDQVIQDAAIAYVKGSATTYVPDDSTLNAISLAASATIPLIGCFRGVPYYRLPSPICVNPNETLQVKANGTTVSGDTYISLEGQKFKNKLLLMRLLPYLKNFSKAMVTDTPTAIVDYTPTQFPLFVQTFGITGVDQVDGTLRILKGLYETLDELHVGTEINEAPLTAFDRMYALNEHFNIGEKLTIDLLQAGTPTVNAYLFSYFIPTPRARR